MTARRRDEEDGGLEDWREYKRLVLDGLDFLRADSQSIRADVTEIKVSIARLQTRAALVGAAIGVVATAVIGALAMKLLG